MMLVAIVHGIKKNDAYITCFLFVVIRFLDDAIKKFTARHFLGDKVVELGFVKNIIPAYVART
jgi:hypothetical protein